VKKVRSIIRGASRRPADSSIEGLDFTHPEWGVTGIVAAQEHRDVKRLSGAMLSEP
jgi:hypothetical protein